MMLNMLKAKIHRAVVTEANINYVGSITIDADLIEAAGLYEYEQVHVVDVDNGSRLVTYIIAGPRGKGDICLNGAAARLVDVGDRVIVMAFCSVDADVVKKHMPKLVFVDENNSVTKIINSEIHGEIE